MWYCIICDRTINNKSKSKHNNSNSLKHKEKYSIPVKVYEFDNPDNNEIFSINKNCARDCHNKCFHSFTFKSIYDIEMRNGDSVNGMISDKKMKNIIRENGFIHKLTIKIYSILSNINRHSYPKYGIPIMHRIFFIKKLIMKIV